MSIWAAIKKAINDNFDYPLNKQKYIPFSFDRCEWFTEARTFTIPETGWYIITCVGKGGNACGNMTGTGSSTGGGGGGGAVTKGKYYLTKGDAYEITVGDPSAFGDLISAGAGGSGGKGVVGTGGEVIIPGNIFAYPGMDASNRTGGSAGATSIWSIPISGAGQGYFPFPNTLECGGKAGTASSSPTKGAWGGGTGGTYGLGGCEFAAGAGGAAFGGGGQAGANGKRTGYTNNGIAAGGTGADGIVIVEYGITLLG